MPKGGQKESFRSVVLKLQHTFESPGRLGKTQIAGLYQVCDILGQKRCLRIRSSTKLLGAAAGAGGGLGTTV